MSFSSSDLNAISRDFKLSVRTQNRFRSGAIRQREHGQVSTRFLSVSRPDGFPAAIRGHPPRCVFRVFESNPRAFRAKTATLYCARALHPVIYYARASTERLLQACKSPIRFVLSTGLCRVQEYRRPERERYTMKRYTRTSIISARFSGNGRNYRDPYSRRIRRMVPAIVTELTGGRATGALRSELMVHYVDRVQVTTVKHDVQARYYRKKKKKKEKETTVMMKKKKKYIQY